MSGHDFARRVHAFLLALIIIFGAAVPAAVFLTPEAEAATTYSYTNYHPYSDYIRFKCNGMTGTCIQPANLNTGEGKATLTKLSNGSKLARIAYYYGVVKKWDTSKSNAYWLKTMLQVTNEPDKAKKVIPTAKINKAKGYINKIPSDLAVPDNFEIYKGNPTNGQQDFVVWKLTPSGQARLIKTSSDAKAAKVGGYDFKGIQYKVYKSDKKTTVGTLTCSAGGTTGTLSLPAGTYYVKESKSNQWYQLNDSWITCTVKSGKTTTVRVKDVPVTVPVTIEKSMEGGTLDPGETVTVRLVNQKDSSVTYTVELTGNRVDFVTKTVSILAGKYTVTEVIPQDAKYVDLTGPQEITVSPGKPVTVKRRNQKVTERSLQVKKTTDDSGAAEGFCFRVSGLLDNAGTLRAEDVLAAAAPVWTPAAGEPAEDKAPTIEESADAASPSTGVQADGDPQAETPEEGTGEPAAEPEPVPWTVDAADLAALNRAAAEGRPGEYAVRISGPAERTVRVTLTAAEPVEGAPSYQWPVRERTEETSEASDGTAVHYNFVWCGAATQYHDAETGEPFTLLTTRADGYGYRKGSDAKGLQPVPAGTYTVEELLTDKQAERYRAPAPQTVTVSEDGQTVTISAENAAKRTPVKLVKSSPNGAVEGIMFRLRGTDAFEKDIDVTAVTDADGKADFGMLYKGQYVIEEISFDPGHYVNNHRLEGYDNPAVAVTVTGEEKEPITVSFENQPITALFLTKVDADTQEFLGDAEFELLDSDGKREARFAVIRNDDGSAGIRVDEAAGDIYGSCEAVTMEDGDSPADEYNYAILYNLTPGKTYTVRETKCPPGYSSSVSEDFTFEDGMKLVLTNRRPVIGTTAMDGETGTHYGHADDDVTIVDTVRYEHLTPGKEYVMRGSLVYQEAADDQEVAAGEAEPVLIEGVQVTASTVFTAGADGSGEVKVSFPSFDGTALRGRSVVVFEECVDLTLPLEDQVVAAHCETDDAAQTVIYPKPAYEMYKVRNEEATRQASSGKYGFQESDEVTYTVVIQNIGDTDLTMDVTDSFLDHPDFFTVPAVAAVEIDGIREGDPAPAEEASESAPEENDPEAARYTISGDGLTATVTVPRGGTARVTFRAVVRPAAAEYLAAAAKDSDSLDADGNDVNRRVRVNAPDENDGYRNAARTTNVTYPNPEASEEPIRFPEGDRDDDAQTPVRSPLIGTSLANDAGAQMMDVSERTVLVDTISYDGLKAGASYVFKGTLMRKRTGEPVVVNGQAVVGYSDVITTEEESGFAEVRFELDTRDLDGEELVAFETAYRLTYADEAAEDVGNGATGVVVAEHNDINNASQTIGINTPVQTGDPQDVGLDALVLLSALMGFTLLFFMRKNG